MLAKSTMLLSEARKLGADKAVEFYERDLERFSHDRDWTLNCVNLVPNMSCNSPGYDVVVLVGSHPREKGCLTKGGVVGKAKK